LILTIFLIFKLGLSGLRDQLADHLQKMHAWKDYLEQDREYESEKIQERTEKEIFDRAYDDQLHYMAEVLLGEHNKLQNLAKLRVIEDQEVRVVFCALQNVDFELLFDL
jgi:hypothetical protein